MKNHHLRLGLFLSTELAKVQTNLSGLLWCYQVSFRPLDTSFFQCRIRSVHDSLRVFPQPHLRIGVIADAGCASCLETLVKGCQVVFYGDNDTARASLIAGRASTSVGGSCTCSWLFYRSVSFSPKSIVGQEDIH